MKKNATRNSAACTRLRASTVPRAASRPNAGDHQEQRWITSCFSDSWGNAEMSRDRRRGAPLTRHASGGIGSHDPGRSRAATGSAVRPRRGRPDARRTAPAIDREHHEERRHRTSSMMTEPISQFIARARPIGSAEQQERLAGRMTSSNQIAGDQDVDDAQRHQVLPGEVHQPVHPHPRQRGPDPEHHEDEEQHLERRRPATRISVDQHVARSSSRP